MSRTAVSKHLRILAEAGLVHERKVGRETRYRLQPEPLQELRQWLSFYERFWDNKLAALTHYVENTVPEKDKPFVPRVVESDERK
jgi:DNA-binding transcriptional ArsR family regulator